MGSWEHVKGGLEMKTDSILYPIWRAKLVIPYEQIASALFSFEYKYAVMVRDGNNREVLVRWETPEANKCFYL